MDEPVCKRDKKYTSICTTGIKEWKKIEIREKYK